jgi:signal transduction histidine kinase
VADQGIGIPPEEQGKLIQSFYRVDSSLRRSTQGAGLGLYLCKSIIEAHGGQIWLRSEPGKGTTVFFTLPVR